MKLQNTSNKPSKHKREEGGRMSKGGHQGYGYGGHGVSGHSHTQEQQDHYANQHNPNNEAYQQDRDNHANQCNPNTDMDEKSDETTNQK